jgi:uncharacterized delta-60 repeat protein
MKNSLLTLLILIASARLASAQFGILDPTFGNSSLPGLDTFPNSGAGNFGQALAFQTDGRILFSTGSSNLGLGRINPSGSLDNTFGNSGWVNNGLFAIEDILLQPDGRILAAGKPTNISWNDTYVWRYKTDGTLDSTFGHNGRAADSTLGAGSEHIALQSGNKIIWSGYLGVKRINLSDGSLDMTFGTNGYIRLPQIPLSPNAMIVDSASGKILLAGFTRGGNHLAIARLTANGALDAGFGNNGVDSLNFKNTGLVFGMKIRINSSGKIVVSADCDKPGSYNQVVCIQFTGNGLLDNSFGTGGIVYPDWKTIGGNYEYFGGMDLQTDGKIVLASLLIDSGVSTSIASAAALRLNANGSEDTLWGVPKFDYYHHGAFIQTIGISPNGRLYANGATNGNEMLARYAIGYPLEIGEESRAVSQLLFYPNPVETNVDLSFTISENAEVSAGIYSLDGRMIREIYSNEKLNAGKYNKSISVEGIDPGIYQIVFSDKYGMRHISFQKL